jgi:hypothetical protein
MNVQAERTDRGLEMVLRPRGAGRFFGAAFLSFWLCGWVVGEAFAVWILYHVARALLSGTPAGPFREPVALGALLAMVGFLLVWLALWTLGGSAALREVLRLVWSKDRIVAGTASLRVLRGVGPFRSTLEIPREKLRRIYLAPRTWALSAETTASPVTLSKLGSHAERRDVASALRDELRVPEDLPVDDAAPALPKGWQETVTPEGDYALVPDLGVRRRQSRVATVFALALTTLAVLLVSQSTNDPSVVPPAVLISVAAAAVTWGAVRLARGRIEWRIGVGSLTRRRRFGWRVRDLLEARSLELTRSRDSDGDECFALEALGPGGPAGRKTIARATDDPTVPRQLGGWLAARAGVPFRDRTTQEAAVEDLERTLASLRESGAVGRWAARWIERASASRR